MMHGYKTKKMIGCSIANKKPRSCADRLMGIVPQSVQIAQSQTPSQAIVVPVEVAKSLVDGTLSCLAVYNAHVPDSFIAEFRLAKTCRRVVPTPLTGRFVLETSQQLQLARVVEGDVASAAAAARALIQESLALVRRDVECLGNIGPHLVNHLSDAAVFADCASEWAHTRDLRETNAAKSWYAVGVIMECLVMVTSVRATHGLKDAILRGAKLILGGEFAQHIANELETRSLPGPTTLSHAKTKFEAAVNAYYQHRFAMYSARSIVMAHYVMSDSSPVSGVELQMTLFGWRRLSSPILHGGGENGSGFDVKEFGEFTATACGLGNMTASDKSVAVVHQIALYVGADPSAILGYGEDVFGVSTDDGTESSLVDIPVTAVSDWARDNKIAEADICSQLRIACLRENLRRPDTAHLAYLFKKSLGVAGTKHAAHNTAKAVSTYISSGQHEKAEHRTSKPILDVDFMTGLKASARVFGLRFLRNRVLATSFKGVPAEDLPGRSYECDRGLPHDELERASRQPKKTWPKRTITEWRWGDVVGVIIPVLLLRDVIEKHWNVASLFYKANECDGADVDPSELADDGNDSADDGGIDYSERSNKTFARANTAFQKPYWWALLEALAMVFGFIEDVLRWDGGCACHGEAMSSIPWHRRTGDLDLGHQCPWKGRRGLCLSMGAIEALLKTLQQVYNVQRFVDGLRVSVEEKARVCSMLQGCLAIVEMNFRVRHMQWMKLPHAVVRVGVSDVEAACDNHRILDPHCVNG
jgi:hypothetical protein